MKTLTALDWAEILKAGALAIPGKSAQPGEALAAALYAMSEHARELSEGQDDD